MVFGGWGGEGEDSTVNSHCACCTSSEQTWLSGIGITLSAVIGWLEINYQAGNSVPWSRSWSIKPIDWSDDYIPLLTSDLNGGNVLQLSGHSVWILCDSDDIWVKYTTPPPTPTSQKRPRKIFKWHCFVTNHQSEAEKDNLQFVNTNSVYDQMPTPPSFWNTYAGDISVY